MMKRIKRSLATLAAVTGVATASAPAMAQGLPFEPSTPGAVLFFDYFLFDNLGQPSNDLRSFLLWNVSGGSVDLVGGRVPGVFTGPPIEPDGRFVDLGGSTGDPGLFETRQLLDLIPGATYNLSFGYRSTVMGQTNSATASFGGQSFTVSSATDQFQLFSGLITTDSLLSSRIAFQGLQSDTDNDGIGIDGVLLRLVARADGEPIGPGLPLPTPETAVPEPGVWAMMLIGLGLIGTALRRRPRRIVIAV